MSKSVRDWDLKGHEPIKAHYFYGGSHAELLREAALFAIGLVDILGISFGYDMESDELTLTLVYGSV